MVPNDTRSAKRQVLRNFMQTTIAQTAKEVFAEHGYQGTTLDAVAKRLGMSKGTIYIYYRNKDDLFLQVVEELIAGILESTAQDAKASKPPLEKLASMVRRKMEYFEHERDFFRIYLHEKQGLDVAPKDLHKQALREMYRQSVDTLAGVIQEGIEAGVIRPMDSRRLACCLQEMSHSILLQRIQGKAKVSLEEDVDQLLELFLHGAERSDFSSP